MFSFIMCLRLQHDRKMYLQTVISSYLHKGATVATKGKHNKESREKVGGLEADLTLPWPLFLFHLDPFRSRTRGGLAGLDTGLCGGLL